MNFEEDEIESIAKACAEYEISVRSVELVSDHFSEIKNIDNFVKAARADADNTVYLLVRNLLRHLGKHERRDIEFAVKLYFQYERDPEFAKVVGETITTAQDRFPAHEAILTTTDLQQTTEQWDQVRASFPRVCCVLGKVDDAYPSGTGFLIGPDRIMTAMHVFGDVLQEKDQSFISKNFWAIFDYEAKSLDPRSLLEDETVTKIPFDRDWMLASSDPFEMDGKIDDPDAQLIATLQNKLDFVVVKLKTPIGDLKIRDRGVKPRGWFKLQCPEEYEFEEDRHITIPQHPRTLARLIDSGRLHRVLGCNTRIVYRVNTDRGSSGAPCLNRESQVIGLHNARFEPNGIVTGNQAVRMDKILNNLGAQATIDNAPRNPRPWKVYNRQNALIPIIGRSTFLDWLFFGLENEPTLRRDQRIFAASPADKNSEETGIAFTAEIAESVLAGVPEDCVVTLGGSQKKIPRRPEDFALLVGAEIGISDDDLRAPPPRPDPLLGNGASDGDKLYRWASHDMPKWFLGLAEKAQQTRWKRNWIILKGLNQFPLSDLVENFVAGLIGCDIDEAATKPIAQQIHWVFLGNVPPFLLAEDTTTEIINADQVEKEDLRDTLHNAYWELGIPIDDNDLNQTASVLLTGAQAVANVNKISILPILQELVAAQVETQRKANG